MTITEMRARINAVSKRLGELALLERTAEQETELDALLAEFNDLGPKLERQAVIDKATADAAKLGESRGRISDIGADDPIVPGGDKPDRRSIGQRFAESEQVKRFLERGAKGKSESVEIGSFYHGPKTIQHDGEMSARELRAIIQTGTLPADYIQPTFVPGIFRGDDLQGSLRDVLINGTTNSDAITFFRELLFTNAAAGVAQATATAGETGLKPESTITFEQDTAPVVTIAHWIPITRQTLSDASQMRTYVEQRLLDGLRLAESDQLLNGTGTPDMDGLLLESGVQALDAAYFTTAPVADDGTPNENFNRLRRAKTLGRTVGRAIPNFVVLNPVNFEKFDTATDANQQYFGAGPYSGERISKIWGLTVVEDENIAENLALVGDGRMAAVWDREQSNILIDTINDQFVRNMLTILAEERLALTVFRPSAFLKVTLVA